MKRLIFIFFSCICIINHAQEIPFYGTVLDSIANPVKDATICKINAYEDISTFGCVKSDRWGKYRIELKDKNKISIEIDYDSIPNVTRYFEFQVDPFYNTGALTEIYSVQEDQVWHFKSKDSTVFTKSFPLKNKESIDYWNKPEKVELDIDSAELMYSDLNRLKVGIAFHAGFSISTIGKTPNLQNTYVQGRPENGTSTFHNYPEAFSYGPNANTLNEIGFYDPQHIFNQAINMESGLGIAFQKKDKY